MEAEVDRLAPPLSPPSLHFRQRQAQGQLREATEIQNLQIGEGDVCRGLVIPIYMVLPRLFSCPTMVTPRFRVEFELNVIVCFAEAAEGYTATQNFQILLV